MKNCLDYLHHQLRSIRKIRVNRESGRWVAWATTANHLFEATGATKSEAIRSVREKVGNIKFVM